jgi:alkylhydroperoxidase family enzyme
VTPRVAPGRIRDTGLFVHVFARMAGRAAGTSPPAVFLTLGRHRRLFWGWLLFSSALMPRGLLPRRETELVILRIATLSGSAYELTQHRRLGRRAGLTEDEIDRVVLGPADPSWGPRDRLLLRATDSLHARRDVSDGLWTELRAQLDEREAIELVMLVGHYAMLATTLNTLRVEPDRPRRLTPDSIALRRSHRPS